MVTKTHMDVGYYGRVRNYFQEATYCNKGQPATWLLFLHVIAGSSQHSSRADLRGGGKGD